MTIGSFLFKAVKYGVTIILALFSGLMLLGWIVNRCGTHGPDFEGFDAEDEEETVLVISDFEASAVDHFIQASITGTMPGGEKTALPLFPKDELETHFSRKYSDWALKPWSTIPFRPAANDPNLDGSPKTDAVEESPSPLLHVVQIASGLDRLMNMSTNRTLVQRSVKAMKSKIWFGMAPISDAKWSSESLDERDNIEEALAILQQVIDIFTYLRSPPIQGALRDMHNHICAEIEIFDDAMEALYTDKGQAAPEWKLSKLWREYIELHLQYMENQARAWIFRRLLILHTAWKDYFMKVLQSGTELNETQTTIKIDHYALMVLNRILDLYVEADLGVRIPTNGLGLPKGIDRRLVGALDGKTHPKRLNAIYSKIEYNRVNTLRKHLKRVLAQKEKEWQQAHPTPSFMKPVARMSCREFAHKHCQPEFENPLQVKSESWIRDVSSDTVSVFGFVIYRVSYTQSNHQWIEFLGRLQAGLNSGWAGLVGADGAKKKATLEWVDSRTRNIAEGDLESVRRHFQTSVASGTIRDMCRTVCLAVTSDAVESFGGTNTDPRGFVYAIDSSFDASNSVDNAEHYDGVFRIVDQLIWTDLYALHAHESCQKLNEFWSLAAEHPHNIYVGPTTGVRRKKWRKSREDSTPQTAQGDLVLNPTEI